MGVSFVNSIDVLLLLVIGVSICQVPGCFVVVPRPNVTATQAKSNPFS
jgi:hypothetical protein